ncbi:MAG TPA: hydrogenase maturation nickel metallochaperone HypA [Terriglobales bacterium]|nr:hydrogenase maturation nickel metallochaperone HypA [Terriglobales bacterium]
MDERELANQVLSAVDDAAYRNSASKVVSVHLAIGGRRVVDLDRLQQQFSAASRGTVAENARLLVKVLPVRHHCRNCGNDFDGTGKESPCSACGNPHTEMVGGEELHLLDMELADVA